MIEAVTAKPEGNGFKALTAGQVAALFKEIAMGHFYELERGQMIKFEDRTGRYSPSHLPSIKPYAWIGEVLFGALIAVVLIGLIGASL